MGLHMVLSMLEYVEGKGSTYVELCQMIRSYISRTTRGQKFWKRSRSDG